MTRLLNWFRCSEAPKTEIRLDDLELGDGDKLVLLYEGYLNADQRHRLKEMMEWALQEDGKRVNLHEVMQKAGRA